MADQDSAISAAPPSETLRIVNLSDLEHLAEARLDPIAWAYYSGGAADEVTLRDNMAAWGRYRLRPRVLVDVGRIDCSTTILGTPVAMPVGVSPTALHGLAWPDGEVGTASGAAAAGLLFTLSSLSSRPLEDLAEIEGPRWFQLYVHRDRAVTEDMLARAEAAGYRAIVLTVDLPVVGRREREARGGFAWSSALRYGNFARYATDNSSLLTALAQDLTWDVVDWLRARCSLPLVVKGVLTGEDASLACDVGFDAVWVSNHGGRQLDGTPATADVLAEVVEAVAGRAEVYADGGVRRGTDVLVALALGATAVFAGRPWIYALAAGGSEGVAAAAGVLRDELEIAMALLGTPRVADITRAYVR